jgi:hypothetical protein
MRVIGELGHEGLPRAIPARKLQAFLESTGAFCSCDASGSAIRQTMARWPFLFSYPLMLTSKPAAHHNEPSA